MTDKRWEETFYALLKAAHIPEPQPEYRFAPPRRWRFDYAWPTHKVALEVDGGVWTGGRHTRGAGFVKDLEKMNEATKRWWRVYRFTPQQMQQGQAIPYLEDALCGHS